MYKWVRSHVKLSHVTHINMLCYTHVNMCVLVQRMSYFTRIHASYHPHEFMSHTRMLHITHRSEFCHADMTQAQCGDSEHILDCHEALIYACIHIHVNTHAHVHTYKYTHIQIHTHTDTHTYICIRMSKSHCTESCHAVFTYYLHHMIVCMQHFVVTQDVFTMSHN